ncbi:MAG: DUF2975 domain-containing protein [Woeseiaceae bacterium]|nr:DUF2975 domain-containing protein [Woeseiaceae bacterium]
MTRTLASLVVWMCAAWLLLLPAGALYYLVNIDSLGALASRNLELPIQWFTVGRGQWYALWGATVVYLSLGYAGVWYLRKAFRSFASGDWFDAQNSRYLRRFAALLVLQGIAKPLHFGLASVILSMKHPPGERMLSISLGSNEAILIVAGLVFWVLADLLVEGTKADAENRQFV